MQESEDGLFVTRTLKRSRLWEIQTPQACTPWKQSLSWSQLHCLPATEPCGTLPLCFTLAHFSITIDVANGRTNSLRDPQVL